MGTEPAVLNIPEMSIGDTIELLAKLYSNAIETDMKLTELPTPFLWSAPGVGKSEGVIQLAEKIETVTKKKVNVSVIHLLLFSPVDLRGVPVADEHHIFTDWLKPRIFDIDSSNDVINILFLDELSAAPQSVQAAAYQLTLDRRIGEHELPDNCIVIAAGNRTTDKSVAYQMPKALCNRLMHFCIKSDLMSWKTWAIENGLDARIIGFLGYDASRLYVDPSPSDLAYPTPRSWSFVDRVIRASADSDISSCHELISACVGLDTALAFEQWCSIYNNLPSIEEILDGRCREYPHKPDELYALISGLSYVIVDKGDKLLSGELENVCAYASRFPVDFAMSFFSDLHDNEKIGVKLLKCHSFTQWLANTGTRL